jgi:dUTP pyrophosphatase
MTKLIFTKIDKDAVIPTYAHDGDAGLDIWSTKETYLYKGNPTILSTGLTVEVPYGFELQIRSRSGLAFNKKVYLANGVGTIDYGFKGEIKVVLVSPYTDIYIKRDKAIAQLVLCRLEPTEVYEDLGNSIKEISQNFTRVRSKGFGSSDE